MAKKIPLLVACLAVVLRVAAQQDILKDAIQSFASQRLYEYEKLDIVWDMEGQVQAELNDGINFIFEDRPDRAEYVLTSLIAKHKNLWQAFYYRGVARKEQGKYMDAKLDFIESIELNKKCYQGYVELAKVLSIGGQYDNSEKHLKTAIGLQPHQAIAHYLLGDIYMTKGQAGRAETNFQKCLTIDSLYHDARIKIGMIRFSEKDSGAYMVSMLDKVLSYDSLHQHAIVLRALLRFKEARTYPDLTRLLRMNSSHLMARFLRGMYAAEKDNYEAAFTDFVKVMDATAASENLYKGQQTFLDKRIDIQNAGVYMLRRVYGLDEKNATLIKRAYVKMLLGHHRDATQCLLEMTTIDEPAMVYLLGVANEHLGWHQQAFSNYDKAIRLDNQLADAFKKRGIYYQELKRWEESIADFSAVLKIHTDAYVMHHYRGVSYYHANKFQEAIADYTAYLQHDSMNTTLIQYRGMAYLRNHERMKAYQDFVLGGNERSRNFRDMTHVVDSTLRAGDTTTVVASLEKIVSQMPWYSEGYARLLKIYLTRNDWTKIEKRLERGMASLRSDAPARDRSFMMLLQGMKESRSSDAGAAMKYFGEAIKADDKNGAAYLERARLYLAAGKESKAQDDLKKASSLGVKEAERVAVDF